MSEDRQSASRKSGRYSDKGGPKPRRSGGYSGERSSGGTGQGGFASNGRKPGHNRGAKRFEGKTQHRDSAPSRGEGASSRRDSDWGGQGGHRDRDNRDSRGQGDRKSFRRDGDFAKRDGERFERRPRRGDGPRDGNAGGFKPRRDGGFKSRSHDGQSHDGAHKSAYRDGDKFGRGPRRDRRRDDDRQGNRGPSRHRSGGQFRRRDDHEQPIQRSLTGSPMPIRVDTKPVVDVPRPWFPEKDEWPEVPRRLLMEIESTAREAEIKEVAVAVMIGTAAFEQGDLDRALEFFSWAKTRAARSITIREGLGICYYVAGEFEQAQRELQAFARISGRAEHNHILADCSRATGNGDRVPELIEQMVEAWKKAPEYLDLMNLIEGLIVLAGYWLEDRNEPERALAAINMVALPDDADITESHLRLWHVQARAAQAAGDHNLAKAALAEIKAVNPEWLTAMNKWIAGEDVEDLLTPWATEVPLPPDPEPQDTTLEQGDTDHPLAVDEDGDILPEQIPEHLMAAAEADTVQPGTNRDGAEHQEPEADHGDDNSWDPGDDWEDEDWDEEDPEPGIPLEGNEELESVSPLGGRVPADPVADTNTVSEMDHHRESIPPVASVSGSAVAEEPDTAQPSDGQVGMADAGLGEHPSETTDPDAAGIATSGVGDSGTDQINEDVRMDEEDAVAQPSLFDE